MVDSSYGAHRPARCAYRRLALALTPYTLAPTSTPLQHHLPYPFCIGFGLVWAGTHNPSTSPPFSP